MIKLLGSPGDKEFEVEFSPRWGYKTGRAIITRKGLYGHYCPTCSNVIQVAFFTDKPVDIWPVEESNIISLAKDKYGETLQTVPGIEKKKGTSQYVNKFFATKTGNVQLLTMKNHILEYQGIVKEEILKSNFQIGEQRPCYYTGCFSTNPSLLLKDLYSFWGCRNYSDAFKYDLEEFITAGKEDDLKLLTAYGEAPPVVLFPKSKVQEGWNSMYYVLNRISRSLKKE